MVLEAPLFTEFAARYLAEDTLHLAPTARPDRRIIRPHGPVLLFLPNNFGFRDLLVDLPDAPDDLLSCEPLPSSMICLAPTTIAHSWLK